MPRRFVGASIQTFLLIALGACQGQASHDHSQHDHGADHGPAPPAVGVLPIGNAHPGYCPVQGDELEVAEATSDPKLHSDFEGKRYLFCCEECKPLFDRNPRKYLANPAPPKKK